MAETHFVPEIVAGAGVSHVFKLYHYPGATTTWEYRHLVTRYRHPVTRRPLIDSWRLLNGNYTAYYSVDGQRIFSHQQPIRTPTFLTARDLAMAAYTLHVTPETSAFLLVLLRILVHEHA